MNDSDGKPLQIGGLYWVIYDEDQEGWSVGEYAYENYFYAPAFDWAREACTIGPKLVPPS